MAEKKIIFDELIKITATEESLAAGWQERKVSEFSAQEGQIFHRPGVQKPCFCNYGFRKRSVQCSADGAPSYSVKAGIQRLIGPGGALYL